MKQRQCKRSVASGGLHGLQSVGGPDAVHIPIDHLRERIGERDKEKPIVFVCRSGQRAYLAARILLQNGFSDVSVFSGGMLMYNQVLSQTQKKE